MIIVTLITLTGMGLASLAGARSSAPTTYRGKLVELGAFVATFGAGWLLQFHLRQLNPIRISALILASYAFARIALDRSDSARHLMPCLALTVGAIAQGTSSASTCLRPGMSP